MACGKAGWSPEALQAVEVKRAHFVENTYMCGVLRAGALGHQLHASHVELPMQESGDAACVAATIQHLRGALAWGWSIKAALALVYANVLHMAPSHIVAASVLMH